MHPADPLSVKPSPDDPETAVRWGLMLSGSPADRAAAAQQVEEASVRAPVNGDLSKPRTVTTREAAATTDSAAPPEGSAEDGDAPKLQRRSDGAGSTPDAAGPDDAPAAGSNDPRRYT